MSAHIAAHRWADAFAGKLAASEVSAFDAHAERCPRCAQARGRVQRASSTFPKLRTQSSPDLAWDSIRARVHWSVSSEKRASQPASRTLLRLLVAAGALTAGGIAVGEMMDSSSPSPHALSSAPAPALPTYTQTPAAELEPTQLAGVIVRETGEHRHSFDQLIKAGDVITTLDARLDVQFDDASALSLAPSTILSVRRLDSDQIELFLQQGSIDVTVTKRSPNQRFLVALATGRTVEVRGTQFRVTEHGNLSRVECVHGKVALRDASGEVEIPGARKQIGRASCRERVLASV